MPGWTTTFTALLLPHAPFARHGAQQNWCALTINWTNILILGATFRTFQTYIENFRKNIIWLLFDNACIAVDQVVLVVFKTLQIVNEQLF